MRSIRKIGNCKYNAKILSHVFPGMQDIPTYQKKKKTVRGCFFTYGSKFQLFENLTEIHKQTSETLVRKCAHKKKSI